jgi:hypothetical protein
MSDDSNKTTLTSDPDSKYVLATYEEICKSYHALDEFRMKLLGLLPIVSIVGLFALDKTELKSAGSVATNEIVAYVGLFATMFNIALFIYEMRGILTCHDLLTSGRALEKLMNVTGQFGVCSEQRSCYVGEWQRRVAQQFNGQTGSMRYLFAGLFRMAVCRAALRLRGSGTYVRFVRSYRASFLLLALMSCCTSWSNPRITE